MRFGNKPPLRQRLNHGLSSLLFNSKKGSMEELKFKSLNIYCGNRWKYIGITSS